MKLTVTKNKKFIEDCIRYEAIIKETRDSELENLYRRFVSQARSLDVSADYIEIFSNTMRQNEEKNKLKSLKLAIENKIKFLKDKSRLS